VTGESVGRELHALGAFATHLVEARIALCLDLGQRLFGAGEYIF
jgi:hypothetical protein